jgi:hypothetical protein
VALSSHRNRVCDVGMCLCFSFFFQTLFEVQEMVKGGQEGVQPELVERLAQIADDTRKQLGLK